MPNNLVSAGSLGTFKPTGASFAESKGTAALPITVTNDFSNVVRGATPDMGALEFTGTIRSSYLDNVENPGILAIGATAINPYNIGCATLQTGEVAPLINTQGDGVNTSNYSWGTTISKTQWYKLTVPTSGEGSSGNLVIRATGGDARLAVWNLPNMGTTPNFTGATLLAANDDEIATGLGSSTNPAVRVHLTPGSIYYVQIDGNTNPTGNIYAEDLSYAPYSVANNGLGSRFNPSGADMRFAAYEVIGTDGYTYYYDNAGTATTLADDNLLMAVNWSTCSSYLYDGMTTYAAGTNLDDHVRRDATSTTAPPATGLLGSVGSGDQLVVWVGRNSTSAASPNLKLTAPYVTSPYWYMMNKYWNLIPSVQPSAAVNVRTFYSDADFNSLQSTVVAAGGVLATHADMKFIKASKTPHYSNAEMDPSLGHGAISTGTVANTSWINTDGVESGINQAQFTVTTFSGGGGGSAGGPGITPLGIKLEYFNGVHQNNTNVLTWKLNSSIASSSETEVERSTDALNFNTIYKTITNNNNNNSYTDATPFSGTNYYRLKVKESNGKMFYSSIITLANQNQGLEITSISPNPITRSNSINVGVTAENATNVLLYIIDIQGKMVFQQNLNALSGLNNFEINVGTLAQGIYQVYGVSNLGKSSVYKLIKE